MSAETIPARRLPTPRSFRATTQRSSGPTQPNHGPEFPIGSVEERQQPPGAPTIVGVLLAELRLEQGLLRVHPCDQRREEQQRDQDADRAAEDQRPTEQAQQ